APHGAAVLVGSCGATRRGAAAAGPRREGGARQQGSRGVSPAPRCPLPAASPAPASGGARQRLGEGEAPFVERAADDGSGDPRRLDAAKILKGGDASRRDDLDSPSQPSDP